MAVFAGTVISSESPGADRMRRDLPTDDGIERDARFGGYHGYGGKKNVILHSNTFSTFDFYILQDGGDGMAVNLPVESDVPQNISLYFVSL